MKTIKKLFTIILLIILSIIKVNADSCNGVNIFANGMGTDDNGGYIGGLPVPKYSFKGTDSTETQSMTYDAFCHDPSISPKISTGSDSLNCNRVLFDPTSTDLNTNPYDIGLVTILGDSASYANRYLAINIYQMYWPFNDTTGSNTNSTAKDFRYWANYWKNNDSDIRSKLDKLRKMMPDGYIIKEDLKNTKKVSDVSDEVKNLVSKGLQAAIDYQSKTSENAIINVGRAKKSAMNSTKEGNVTTYSQKITYEIKVDNFKSSTASVKLKFNCSNCATYGVQTNVTLKSSVKDKEETLSVANLSSKELANSDYLKDGSGVITVILEFTGKSTNYLCNDLKYKLTVNYNDAKIGARAYEVSKCKGSNSCQGFYIVEKSNKTREVIIEDSTTLCNLSCTELKDMCNAGNAKACDRFNNEYDGDCVFCTSSVPEVECESCNPNEHKVDIVEGYNLDESKCEQPSASKLNIKKCIANDTAKDTAGNKYKVDDLSNVSSYANVYCKEDYFMTFPGTIEVDSGRYFTLTSSIEGTKSCYTSEISDAGLDAKILDAAKKSMDAYEFYLDLLSKSEAVAAGRTRDTGVPGLYLRRELDECGRSTYHSEGKELACLQNCDKNPEDLESTEYNNCLKYCSDNSYVTLIKYKVTPVVDLIWRDIDCVFGQAGSCPAGSHISVKPGIKRGTPSACGAYRIDGETIIDEAGEEYGAYLIGEIGGIYSYKKPVPGPSAKGGGHSITYTDATGAIKNTYVGVSMIHDVLTEYNKATGYYSGSFPVDINSNTYTAGWQMWYKFNPEMYYWYQEEYMNDVISDKMALNGNIKVDEKPSYKYCTGTVSNDFKNCSTGWVKGTPPTETKSVWACDLNGCRWFSYAKSQVKRTMGEMNASAKFITPTQFYTIYPSGSIVVAEGGVDITNAKKLDNALPIGLGTPTGKRTYLLWIENLGEYYNSNDLGRIWGDAKSVVATNLRNSTACLTEKSALKLDKTIDEKYFDEGIYACEYDINYCSECKIVPDGKCDPDCEDDPDCPNDCSIIPDGKCDPDCDDDPDCVDPCANGACSCKKYKDQYYGPDGEELDPNTESHMREVCCPEGVCPDDCSMIPDNKCDPNCEGDPDCLDPCHDGNCTCKEVNGTYYGPDGKPVTPNTFQKMQQLCCPTCPTEVVNPCVIARDEEGSHYYDNFGREVDETTYKQKCCSDGNCPVICKTCIYDGDKLVVDYRPVTNEDMNPNNRELGRNWKWDNEINTAYELKAYAATQEIQNNAESIYDVDFTKKNDANEFAMQVTMDTQMITKIRELNEKDDIGKGNYNYNTLTCYDYTEDDRTFENVFCYSNFIDELIDSYKDKIKFSKVRPSTPNDRENNAHNYFTLWEDADERKWNITTERGMTIKYYKSHFGKENDPTTGDVKDYYVGPSWK